MTEFELLDPTGLIQLQKWVRQQRLRLMARSILTPVLLAVMVVLGHYVGLYLAPYLAPYVAPRLLTGDPTMTSKPTGQAELQGLIDACHARLSDSRASTKLTSDSPGEPTDPHIRAPNAANAFLSIPNRLIDSSGRGWSFNPENLQWQAESP